jgi:hypothetical protein
MKVNKRRLLIELTATAVASPILLFLLIRLNASNILAVLAFPTLPLARVASNMILAASPPQGGWFPGLGATLLAEVFILPLWTWILLLILVKLVERFIPRRENA